MVTWKGHKIGSGRKTKPRFIKCISYCMPSFLLFFCPKSFNEVLCFHQGQDLWSNIKTVGKLGWVKVLWYLFLCNFWSRVSGIYLSEGGMGAFLLPPIFEIFLKSQFVRQPVRQIACNFSCTGYHQPLSLC